MVALLHKNSIKRSWHALKPMRMKRRLRTKRRLGMRLSFVTCKVGKLLPWVMFGLEYMVTDVIYGSDVDYGIIYDYISLWL